MHQCARSQQAGLPRTRNHTLASVAAACESKLRLRGAPWGCKRAAQVTLDVDETDGSRCACARVGQVSRILIFARVCVHRIITEGLRISRRAPAAAPFSLPAVPKYTIDAFCRGRQRLDCGDAVFAEGFGARVSGRRTHAQRPEQRLCMSAEA